MSESSAFFGQARRQELKLEFFGGPALWRGGESVRISPFQAGLLSIAFGSGQARVPRSMVQRLLWGVDHGKTVRHRLSQLVYQTNHRCRTRVIALEGEYVRVDTRAVATDLQEFEELIRASDFAAALGLLERGFLSAFPSRKTDALADWIEKHEIGKRTHLRNRALATWGTSAASNDWLNARESAEALLRLDPNDEVILRRVIRAQAMGGMVREAEALYRSFGEHADPSGRWRPERKTRDLLRMVKVLARLPGRKSGVSGDEGFDVPLAGRASELAHLARSIFRNSSGRMWHTITVSGEAGLGKTRLVEEAMHGAELRGYQVLRACPGALERDIPLSPLLDALNQPWVASILQSLADPWQSHLLSLLPQFGKTATPRSELPHGHTGHREVLRRHTCEAFLRLFTAIAESRPTLLFLDDFHSTDETSATVVQFLHRRWERGDLTLLLCHRQEELARNERAARLIAEMEADAGSTRIRLRELTESSAKKLVTTLGAEQLDESGVARIVRLGGGNPLFLIELAADRLAGGDRQRGDGAVRVPSAVRAMVARRLGELEPGARKVLSGLAVLGRPATLRQLSRITGQSRHECLDSLESLQELRFVAREGDKVSIRQGIVRHAVYQDLSPARRAMLHGLAAESLGSGSAGVQPDVARHYYRAGDRRFAYICALEAAKPEVDCPPADRLGLLRIAYEVSEGARRDRVTLLLARVHHRARRLHPACRYAEEALRTERGLRHSDLADMRMIAADSRYLLGREPLSSTLAQLAELENEARDAGDDAALASVLDTTLMALHRAGKHGEVVRLLAMIDGMGRFREARANCRILAARAMVARYGDPAAGVARAHRAVNIARESKLHGEVMLARQRHIAALATGGLLATEQGRSAVAEAGPEARRSDDLSSHFLILLTRARWHTTTGDHRIAARILDEARTVAAPMDCPEIRALEHLARGNLALARGDLQGALSALQGACGPAGLPRETSAPGNDGLPDSSEGLEGQETEMLPILADSMAGLEGSLCLESGRFARAAEVAEHHPVAKPPGSAPLELILFHARLLSRRGDTPASLALLQSEAEARESDRPVHWLRLMLDFVRLARRSGNARPEFAARARDRAREINLPGLAHEFVPFTR